MECLVGTLAVVVEQTGKLGKKLFSPKNGYDVTPKKRYYMPLLYTVMYCTL